MDAKILDDFFDFSQPCPKEIPLCEKVRESYQQELSKLTATGCSSCNKVSLKARYVEAIWKEIVSSLTPKAS